MAGGIRDMTNHWREEDRKKKEEQSKLSKRGKTNREKGKRWERELAKMFAESLPGVECKRFGYAQGAGGKNASDVECGGLFWVEAKVGKKPNIRKALDQVLADSLDSPGAYPVACIKDLHGAQMAVMELGDFLELVQEWHERGEK